MRLTVRCSSRIASPLRRNAIKQEEGLADPVLEAFYRRVRPGGPGWVRISTRLGYGREPIPGGALAWTNWVAGIVAVYATLFGIGKIVFGFTGVGLVMLAVAAVAFYWISRSFTSEAAASAAPKVRVV